MGQSMNKKLFFYFAKPIPNNSSPWTEHSRKFKDAMHQFKLQACQFELVNSMNTDTGSGKIHQGRRAVKQLSKIDRFVIILEAISLEWLPALKTILDRSALSW